MGTKNSTRNAGHFGEGARCGHGESGEQMCLFTDSANDFNTTDPRYELARKRADEAMERIAECPEMLQAVRRYCEDCASKGRRIEAHAAFGYVKNHNFINHSTGQEFDLNNNHIGFFLRILAAENPNVAAHMKFRGSMFDLLDMNKYVAAIGSR